MAKVDIKGAFAQTPMEGPDVYMRIRRKVVAYLLVMYPEFAEYVQADGSIITLLLKAMYGCVQASKLWYNPQERYWEAEGMWFLRRIRV